MNNGMKVWNIESSLERGNRATVKLWPAGCRYRMLRGPWHDTGNRDRDFYLSQVALQKRIAELWH